MCNPVKVLVCTDTPVRMLLSTSHWCHSNPAQYAKTMPHTVWGAVARECVCVGVCVVCVCVCVWTGPCFIQYGGAAAHENLWFHHDDIKSERAKSVHQGFVCH